MTRDITARALIALALLMHSGWVTLAQTPRGLDLRGGTQFVLVKP